MNSINYIITAKHYAKQRDGVKTVAERIKRQQERVIRKGVLFVPLTTGRAREVKARIELGQWIADCECKGAEFVDPDEPIFFCSSCLNREFKHRLRTVVFPENYKEIEQLVLQRPVDDLSGIDDLQRAHQAKPLIHVEQPDGSRLPLTRSWNPGESLQDLHDQQDAAIKAWKKKENK